MGLKIYSLVKAWNPPDIGSERREKMPDSAFLLPDEKKFPVKTKDKKTGEWKLSQNGLKAAMSRAGQHGYADVLERAQKLYTDNFEKSFDSELRALHSQRVYDSLGAGLHETVNLVKSFGCRISEEATNWKPIGRDESAKYELDIGLGDKKLFLSVYRGPGGGHEFYTCLIGG